MNAPAALIFFNRPDTLKLVFEQVRLAKPERLFLIQDGPREGRDDDIENIKKCREIVDEIDWQCEVSKNYSEINLGCGMRPQTGITWVLSQADRTIILEDDCVPNQTFFKYCDSLLEKYKDDERIAYISGLNHFEKWDFGGSSYGFTKRGSIWGWATWARAWKDYDYSVSAINDPYVEACLLKKHPDEKDRIELWKTTNKKVSAGEKLSYWDVQWGFVKYAQSKLVIVPEYNLIRNIGVGESSTHFKGGASEHKRFTDFNDMPTFDLEFPLKEPKAVIIDKDYDETLTKCFKNIKRQAKLKALKRKIGLK